MGRSENRTKWCLAIESISDRQAVILCVFNQDSAEFLPGLSSPVCPVISTTKRCKVSQLAGENFSRPLASAGSVLSSQPSSPFKQNFSWKIIFPSSWPRCMTRAQPGIFCDIQAWDEAADWFIQLTIALFQVSSDWGTMTLPEREPDPSLITTGVARGVTTSAPERASPSR